MEREHSINTALRAWMMATGVLDPLHNVVGEKPTAESPWFLQVGRVRIRDFKKTSYGFTLTGRSYHNRERFGRLVIEEKQ